MAQFSETNWLAVGVVGLTALFVTLPLVAIFLANQKPKERPLRLEEEYPDGHLGI